MCNSKYTIATTLALLVTTSSGVADDLTIPNTFQPNTPARAADVNNNFAAVEASVDDNAADIVANSVGVATNSADIQALNASIAGLGSGGTGLLVFFSNGQDPNNHCHFVHFPTARQFAWNPSTLRVGRLPDRWFAVSC